MKTCLYCRSAGPFTTVEHVIPESLGNDELILKEGVCDKCQSYFGKEVEQYVLSKTPIGVWRTLIGIKTKKGRLPAVDISQANKVKGNLPDTLWRHDDIGFAAHSDGSTSVDITDDSMVRSLLGGRKHQFNLVLTPKKLSMLGRFLGKVGLGVLAVSDFDAALNPKFDRIRKYARFGSSTDIWPIFHYSWGRVGQWRRTKLLGPKGEALLEEIDCYSYGIVEVGQLYTLFRISIGTDTWVISLNEPYASPIIRSAFPGRELRLIWYSPEEWKPNQAMQRTR